MVTPFIFPSFSFAYVSSLSVQFNNCYSLLVSIIHREYTMFVAIWHQKTNQHMTFHCTSYWIISFSAHALYHYSHTSFALSANLSSFWQYQSYSEHHVYYTLIFLDFLFHIYTIISHDSFTPTRFSSILLQFSFPAWSVPHTGDTRTTLSDLWTLYCCYSFTKPRLLPSSIHFLGTIPLRIS